MKIAAMPDTRFTEMLTTAIAAPLTRLAEVPAWAKVAAPVAALVQYVQHDAFGGALSLLIASGVVDYYFGTKAARYEGKFDPRLAHAGAMGKMTGVLLLFLVRWSEYYVFSQGLMDTHGAAATAVAVSLIAVDLQSIAHHRETFGATPIPVLSSALNWLQQLAGSRLPPSGGAK